MVRDKWLPAPLFPEDKRGHHATPAVARDVLSDDNLHAASRKLNRGSATDALGWTHESWTATQQLPHGAKLLRELLTLYSTGGLGQEGQDLFNASLVVPLYKNEAGSAVRPIAIPSVHRKVLAKTTVAAFRAELQAAAGPAQHAAMASNGTLRMAQRVQTHLRRERRDCIYIRTDIQKRLQRSGPTGGPRRPGNELTPLWQPCISRGSISPQRRSCRQTRAPAAS